MPAQEIAATLFIVMLCHWLIQFVKKYNRLSKHIPGPTPLPLLGNVGYTLNLISGGNFISTVKKLQQKYGRVFLLWMGPFPIVFVTDIGAIQQILSNPSIFEKGPDYTQKFASVFGEGLVTSNGETHKKARSIIGRFFVRKAVDVRI